MATYEHIAWPGCATKGYSAYRLSVEEMAGCRALQALLVASEDWQEEDDYQDLHPTVSSPDYLMAHPTRVQQGIYILKIIKACHSTPLVLKYSKEPRSNDLQPLMSTDFGLWRYLEGSYDESLTFPRSNAVENGQQQYWADELGNDSERDDIHGKPQPNSAFDGALTFDYNSAEERWKGMHETLPPTKTKDLFSGLPSELRCLIIGHLSANDIAHLRLVTPAYRQLSFSACKTLLLHEMPWLWETRDLNVSDTD
ncbi:uncharacterized protein RSE6_03778 [Rhynchosporium secalis]|uniref:F-box domain-containing protein n=1 Tax=Rhynchosporium secalis TaxID=38038 RepID=A0A1E1M545_RHYSE|nr:uncharacterized protein RSE6_03778 [Rhynchosporium secalis]